MIIVELSAFSWYNWSHEKADDSVVYQDLRRD
uniref:Uncharacterized protein n=1 Tax=Siphoviridae sp. ctVJE9 TaxID=2825530 RepID=A0A8S5TUK2_9CAUD|nr:MAG TPA: hypothetical protein [Siphoviridae sp. ctVJE9]